MFDDHVVRKEALQDYKNIDFIKTSPPRLKY